MNRMEAIMTIKKVGAHFSSVMSVLNGDEFAAGYRQAISDMIKMFGKAPIDPDFEAEREAMLAHIRKLNEENDFLKKEYDKQAATIEELVKHIDLHEVLGISKKNSEEPKAQRRGVAFVFK